MAGQPTRQRDLAFLSACQTAKGSVRHLDEAIHLAAAMQFVGYQHVIATMWTIADPPAPHVADTVCTALNQGGRPDPDRSAAPSATSTPPIRCMAPYIHFGT
jgi:CHAT domain